MRAAQVQERGVVVALYRPDPAPGGAALSAEPMGSGTRRPYATTRSRQRAWEAVTFY